MNKDKSLLDQIKSIKDLKKFDEKELVLLANELRQEVIDVVSKTGGHLGASLGVIELTICLHYVFNAPKDKISDESVKERSIKPPNINIPSILDIINTSSTKKKLNNIEKW